MSRIIRSRQAKRDVLQIWVSVAEDSVRAADNLVDTFDEKLRMLARWPNAGQLRPELAPSLRSFPVGQYLMFYSVLDGGIALVRVIHGARDVRRIFKPKGK